MGRLAAVQGGVVSRGQAVALGVGPRAIDIRIGAGRWARLHRGVYAVGHLALTPRGRAIGALLFVSGSILSHRTAGVVWVVIEDDLATPDVTVMRASRGDRPTVRLHRSTSLSGDDVTTRHDLPITNLPRTLLDLADVCAEAELAQAVREARVRHHVEPEQLVALIRRSPGRHGAAALRRILDGPAGEPTRSHTERRYLSLIAQARLPRPEVNVSIGRYVCDFVWREPRLIVEIDAWSTHGDRRSFEADRARDANLGVQGWRVHRFTRVQVRDEPVHVAATTALLLGA